MRLVVLLSGSGSNFQAVIDAVATGDLDLDIVAAGSDVHKKPTSRHLWSITRRMTLAVHGL